MFILFATTVNTTVTVLVPSPFSIKQRQEGHQWHRAAYEKGWGDQAWFQQGLWGRQTPAYKMNASWAFLLFAPLLPPGKGRSTILTHTTSSSNLKNKMNPHFRKLNSTPSPISDKANLVPMQHRLLSPFLFLLQDKVPWQRQLKVL